MDGTPICHPTPKGPLPAPESYWSASPRSNPARPGDVAIGTLSDAVPVAALAENFSPMLRTAPPPLGADKVGSPRLGVALSGDGSLNVDSGRKASAIELGDA